MRPNCQPLSAPAGPPQIVHQNLNTQPDKNVNPPPLRPAELATVNPMPIEYCDNMITYHHISINQLINHHISINITLSRFVSQYSENDVMSTRTGVRYGAVRYTVPYRGPKGSVLYRVFTYRAQS